MKIAVAEIVHETDTFTPARVGLEPFEANGLYQGAAVLDQLAGVGAIGGLLQAVDERGVDCDLVPLVRAFGIAGSTILTATYDELLQMLIEPLRHAGPLDGIFLSLHGAAVAEQDDDVEGALLEAVREVVGPQVPLVVPLDHHGNITSRMVAAADMLIGHETQPHNTFDTGLKAGRLLLQWLLNGRRPAMGWRKIPMITPQDQYLTSGGPMKVWFDRARELEQRGDVMDVSPYPMQPWLDVREAGWAVVVHTVDDQELAEELAADMANHAWQTRGEFWKSERVAPDEAVRRAYAAEQGLVILSDTGDSVYGGAPGDSTCLLRHILLQAGDEAAVMLVPMVDPQATTAAFGAGVGARLDVELGARIDNVFSEPVRMSASVAALSSNHVVDMGERGRTELGRTALLRAGGVCVVVMEHGGYGINHPVMYSHLGVDVDQARAVVVKTASNFQHFAPWRCELVRVDSPGMTQSDLTAFEWHHAPRPLYPLDADLTDWQA